MLGDGQLESKDTDRKYLWDDAGMKIQGMCEDSYFQNLGGCSSFNGSPRGMMSRSTEC